MTTRMLRLVAVCVLLVTAAGLSSGQLRSGKFGVGAAGSAYLFTGSDRPTKLTTYGGGISISYSPMEYVGIRSMWAYGQLGWKNAAGGQEYTDLFSGNFYLSLDMMPNSEFNPFLLAGAGYVLFVPRAADGTYYFSAKSSDTDLQYLLGGGVEYFPSEFISLTGQFEYAMTNLKTYAGYTAYEKSTNSYMRVSLQVRYYFFDQDFITKLLEALKERYEGKK